MAVDPGSEPQESARPAGFERSSQHVLMLEDRVRTRGFPQAIRETVRPGDVVVDIGTGTGILAIAAALAGARHVYAVELTAMAETARRGITANGLADRVTVVHGTSTEISLPERADVVISETIGDDLFDESILPTLADAAARLAKPTARFVPRALRPVVIPTCIDDEIWRRRFYSPELVRGWSDEYVIDLSWLDAEPRRAERFPRARAYLGDGPRIDLPAVTFPGTDATYDRTVTWTADRALRVNALLLGFASDLGPVTLTNVTRDTSSWELPADVLPQTYEIHEGDTVDVRVRWSAGMSAVEWQPIP